MGSIKLIFALLALSLLAKCSAPQNDGNVNGTADTLLISQKEHRAVIGANAKGKLFIIGGGARPEKLMKSLVDLALSNGGYALVFTHPSAEPDTAFHYVEKQLSAHSDLPVIHVDSARVANFPTDSVANAALIYITGGNQNRFFDAVPKTYVSAIYRGYIHGTVVAGTSAGAAMMGKIMITGDQYMYTEYEPTYGRLLYNNGVYAEGLGLLDSVIIDQHFVARSRYNRILSAMADTKYPYAVGIEESTALVVNRDSCAVVGEGQVMVFSRPQAYFEQDGKIGFKRMKISAYLPGTGFKFEKL
ncbi:MAG: cyanophycinase [Cryomorphaceae bacterium]|nr:cyanophycinase [Flavobacteriales bacterium]